MTINKPLPPKEVLEQIFLYEPSTGFLIWKNRPEWLFRSSRGHKAFNARHSGKVAGRRMHDREGRRRAIFITLTMPGKAPATFIAHRIVWKMITGEEPPAEIDHIDGDPFNNKFSNFRDGTNGENKRNICMRSTNKSGVTGVRWCANSKKWIAHARVDGRQTYLGSFGINDIDIAAMEVMEVRAEAGYAPTHGIRDGHIKKCGRYFHQGAA